jgi:hypothetical protein
MADKDYDELSTRRDIVRLLANGASAEQLDAAMHACIDSHMNDAERRTILIQTIYRSWYERLEKRPRSRGGDFALTWEDVERMFLDVHEIVGAARPPQRQSRSSDEKSDGPDATVSVNRSPLNDRLLSLASPEEEMSPASRSSAEIPEYANDSNVLEHIRRALGEPLPQTSSIDQKSDMAMPIRARLSLDWARARPIT